MSKKINWQILSKKGSNFELLLISLVARGMYFNSLPGNKKPGRFALKLYRQVDAHRDTRKEDIHKFITQNKKREAQNPGFILKSYLIYEKELIKMVKFTDRLKDIEFSSCSNRQLINFLEKLQKVVCNHIDYLYNYNYHQYLGDDLYNIIRQKESNLEKQAKLFEIFSQAKEPSVMQKEQKDFWQLIKKIKEKKGKKIQLIDHHLKKYAYLGLFYFKGKLWDKKYLDTRVKDNLSRDHNKEIKSITQFEKDNNNWLKLAHQLKFNQKEILLIKTVKHMAYCTNLFDETWNYFTYHSQHLWQEITKRFNIKYNQLIEMDIQEIVCYLEEAKTPSLEFKQELKERIRDNTYMLENGQVKIFTGQKLKQYRKLEVSQEKINKNIKEFRGQPASIGKAQGRISLVYGVADLTKVRKGDIMLAKNTVPSFVPAMERASAILTEIGGLLSHAAIVSRELKTPCIVGIKNITDILKDGDLVAVDAKQGIVKILKN